MTTAVIAIITLIGVTKGLKVLDVLEQWGLYITLLIIVLLLFGGARLPSLMRNLGSSAREFKKGVQGAEEDEDDDETTPTGIDKDE